MEGRARNGAMERWVGASEVGRLAAEEKVGEVKGKESEGTGVDVMLWSLLGKEHGKPLDADLERGSMYFAPYPSFGFKAATSG